MPEPDVTEKDVVSRLGTLIKDVGLPAVIAMILLLRLEPAMVSLTNAVNWSTYIMGEVQKRLALDESERTQMRQEHQQILNRLEDEERRRRAQLPPP